MTESFLLLHEPVLTAICLMNDPGCTNKDIRNPEAIAFGFFMKSDYGGDSKITCQGLADLGRVHGIRCSLSGYSKIAC